MDTNSEETRESLANQAVDGSDDPKSPQSDRPPGDQTNFAPAVSSTVIGDSPRPAFVPGNLGTDRYKQGEMLGKGGMGEVRTHVDTRIGREVAIKVLSPRKSPRGRSAKRFVQEAMLQGQLEHPTVVPIYDVGTTVDGRPYFSMKRVRGQTLSEVLRGRRSGDPSMVEAFSVRRLLEDFSRLCLAVDFVHQRGVIHRDIKPANVMLGEFGEVYLLDWGLAKYEADDSIAESGDEETSLDTDGRIEAPEPTKDGVMLGTPGYMAPEQARGNRMVQVGPEADIYALGVLLYEIVTDRRLHSGRTAKERLHSTMSIGIVRVGKLFPELAISSQISSLIETALNPVAERRTCSPREMHNQIQRHLDGYRDVESRRRQAEDLYALAKEAGRSRGDESIQDARVRKLELLGRALALQPDHSGALSDFVELLAVPLKEMPVEVLKEIKEVEANQVRSAGRLGALVFLGLNFFTLWLVWMADFTEWAHVLPFIACTTATGGVSFAVSKSKDPGPQHSYLVFVLAVLTTASLVSFFGVFVVVPSMLAVVTMAFALNTPARWGWRVIGTGGAAIIMLSLLPVFGLVSSGIASEAGTFMVVVPLKVKTAGEMQLFVTIAGCAVVMLAGFAIVPLRLRLDLAQRRARMTTWQLRHLIPSQIRFMGNMYSSSVMRVSDIESDSAEDDPAARATRQAGVSGVYTTKSLSSDRDSGSKS